MPAATILSWWRGHPAGWWNPADYNVASICVPIGTHVPHAAGLAWGKKLKGESACAIAYFGDGATSEGAFHEGANFAGVMRAPLILFCNNNQWAISTPLSAQTAAASLADKAIGYGMPGVRVDGLDVLAVFEATRDAVARARAGQGPSFIEAGLVPRRPACDRRRPARLHRPRPGRGGEEARVSRPLRGLPSARRAADRRDGRVGADRGCRPHARGDRGGRGRAAADPELLFENAFVLPPPNTPRGLAWLSSPSSRRSMTRSTSSSSAIPTSWSWARTSVAPAAFSARRRACATVSAPTAAWTRRSRRPGSSARPSACAWPGGGRCARCSTTPSATRVSTS